MFEQSILAEQPTNKPLTLAISLSIQALLVFIIGLIPLIYTQQIPTFVRWVQGVPAPAPLRPSEPVQQARAVRPSAATSAIVAPRSIPHIIVMRREEPAAVILEPAGPGVVGATGDPSAAAGLSRFLEQTAPAPVKPPQNQAVTKPRTEPRAAAPIRVSEGVQEAKLLRRVMPVYPQIAIAARISGTVELLGVISKDGTIKNLQVISGSPMLVRAAVDAVRQWVYKPTLLSGQPVEVIAPIQVTFTLNR